MSKQDLTNIIGELLIWKIESKANRPVNAQRDESNLKEIQSMQVKENFKNNYR